MANVLVNINDQTLADIDIIVKQRKSAKRAAAEFKPIYTQAQINEATRITRRTMRGKIGPCVEANDYLRKIADKQRAALSVDGQTPSRVKLINELVILGLTALNKAG